MARPIALETPPRDLRKEREEQLKQAQIDHAEAILNGYELLEQLHKSRAFELLRGVFGTTGDLTEKVATAADTPQSVNAMRNLILLAKMLGSIDPEVMESYVAAVTGTVGHKPSPDIEPPGLFSVLNQLRRREVRRALVLVNRFLEIFGNRLGPKPGITILSRGNRGASKSDGLSRK
ncbi:MAG TPA: hypothetical protein VFB43_08965 [Terracidiphilus sp.]|jgi:uncharacterized protein YjgD (DUF1641 family)|nr:hypothetical protein [Terracidiphilus sp.]